MSVSDINYMELRTSTIELASDPNISEETLNALLDLAAGPAQTGKFPTLLEAKLRDALAANPSCPEEVKDTLIVGPHVESARHVYAAADLLQYLSKHENAEVRAAVADNRRTPASVLLALCLDDVSVMSSAVLNPSCPAVGLNEAWNQIVEAGAGPVYDLAIVSIAQHPNTPSAVLLAIIQTGTMEQASEAASNPALDTDILSALIDDAACPPQLRMLAARNINNPYCQAMLLNVFEAAISAYSQLLDRGVEPMTAASVVHVGIAGNIQ